MKISSTANVALQVKRLRVGETLVRRNPSSYPRAVRRFDQLERATLGERRAWTDRRLASVLSAARETRYGRELGSPASIEDWPVLEKDRVREAPMDLVRGWHRLAATAETSGTTGLPLRVWRSLSSLPVEQAAIDRLIAHVGVDPQDYRAAVLRGDDIKDPADRNPPYWVTMAGGRRLVLSSNHLNADTVGDFVEALRTFRPDVLHAYPTILESLCLLLQASGRKLRIPVVICSSEALPETTWRLAAETLGARLVDYYGLAERVSFAYAYEPGAYTFLAGYSYNELLPYGREGSTHVYEIVATGLWNLKMPLVRFRTGDLIRLQRGGDTTAIAYGVVTFPELLGRTGDYLIAPDGARLMGIDHIPRGIDNVLRMQVIQDRPDTVRVLVLPAPGFREDDRVAILANAKKKLPPTVDVSVRVVATLDRTSAGKVPFVIRRIPDPGERR